MKLFAKEVLLAAGWARDTVVEIDGDGVIADVTTGVRRPEDAEVARGPLIPGMPNLHSHAFQRALAGFSERRGPGEDSFWTWRRVMYEFVARLTPAQSQAIAEHLYVEMLKGGYTAVGEFHYLHHDPLGRTYENLTEMSDGVIAAAQAAGIAITHLPVLYRYGGFGGEPPASTQRRFVNDMRRYTELVEQLLLRYRGQSGVRVGIAPHSLRAVDPRMLEEAVALVHRLDPGAPVHLHIAEQTREVDDCLAWCGQRPVAWLLDHAQVDARWCLVHATHMVEDEVARLARSGAVAGLCPSTEANLGDGLFPAVAYLALDGRFGIGSDSHVSVSPFEELRLLEYGQRLLHRRRTLLAREPGSSVGASLYREAALAGARALGMHAGSIDTGRRADLVVLHPDAPALAGKSGDLLLDAAVFAGGMNPVRDVMVGGEWQVLDGHHTAEEAALARFRRVLREIQVP